MKKWNEITSGSKITLLQNTLFDGLGGEFLLNQGEYYIVGFWANICGLSKNRNDINKGCCDIHIPSRSLNKFKEITK